MPQRATQGAAVLAAGMACSRLLGFVRDMLLAYLLGAGADPFLVAFRIPNFLRRLLTEGSLGMAHGAEVSRKLITRGRAAALVFSRAVCLRLFLFSLIVTALLELFAFPVSVLLAPGLSYPALEKSALLLRLCLPYLPLCAASAIALVYAAALGNFRPQAWSSICLNTAILCAGGSALLLPCGAALTLFGVRLTIAEIFLCAGIVCGGLAQGCLGLRVLCRPDVGTREKIREMTTRAEVDALLRHLPASALGAAPQQLHLLAGTILASFLAPGSISSLYFAERLFELPLALAGVAVGLGSFVQLTAQAARKDMENFTHTLSDAIRLSAFLSLPAAVGLFTLACPLAAVLFGHGAFGREQTAATAAALRMYALGLPAMCAARPFLVAAPALNMPRVPLRTACVSLIVFLPISLAGIAFSDGGMPGTTAGLALGLSVGAWTNAFLLSRRLQTCGILRLWRPLRGTLATYVFGALIMAGILTFVNTRYGPLSAGPLLLLTGVCCGLWIACFRALKNKDARFLLDVLCGSRKKQQDNFIIQMR
ncbi:MAG: hypothetical protein LBD42_04170 [Desulfovibrio sp.]|jgi:putative peptidoglycan lipid II flippase|nr:hypothetical protein [Desulfovibrio sp.]